ncbi:hypothetical protein A3C21_00445 [Candidatus Kaiserbacteria bacterium RIFCSPHIGHO2_02_FULL_59_21]|uniref:Transcriptional regulator, PaaX family n=2 Tax=Candidatus Kaiseribacteriota TaxID=1752734 RepID=A0A0G2BKY4_9BACT|nr:MAG: Transcriptional regulator, PaaX family [Candidatus Kaiserbacteria bacterium GW2011_GWA2_58_9]OGG62843.1 MAG: hypothetical protein A2766_03275 [Candidatus Kaiserbacteria bacterium RIFCSPHIGHO2_01_FULL_58_22]OGG67326.1 MAG: hypothetical protein A3C21_00445 [Candidatus Kaiserbacteria bacterium RIFCSPHIGHO2_02_FULL_59_21]OGG78953.1 MAG: hypothetical protein A2952_02365 [Candidatus Kaiserbacteria bacterium RIFCSPLOWO2_01_FULL_59_34]OGG86613.1 MAG: hypothetical protein A3I47_03905 [Candidatus
MSGKRRHKRRTFGPIEEDIVRNLTAGDLLMSFLMSARSTRAFHGEARKRARARYHYRRSAEGLERRGVVRRRGDAISLTEQGKEIARILSSQSGARDSAWNGRWRIVMYDIPVSLNPFRFELRRILVGAGFRKLQHSVWIHPRPCEELEAFLQRNMKLARYVRYVEISPFPHMRTLADWKKLGVT